MDYAKQKQADYARALRAHKDTEQKLELAKGRYDEAMSNSAGAGRGKQGGATVKQLQEYRSGGQAKKPPAYKKGGSVSSASTRADGAAQRGKTRGKLC